MYVYIHSLCVYVLLNNGIMCVCDNARDAKAGGLNHIYYIYIRMCTVMSRRRRDSTEYVWGNKWLSTPGTTLDTRLRSAHRNPVHLRKCCSSERSD